MPKNVTLHTCYKNEILFILSARETYTFQYYPKHFYLPYTIILMNPKQDYFSQIYLDVRNINDNGFYLKSG